MKNIIKLLIVSLVICSCSESDFEPVIYDGSLVGIGFQQQTSNVTIFPAGETITIPVQTTTTSSSARTFNVVVNTEESNANASDYVLTNVVIPANEYNGEFVVQIANFENLPDMVVQKLVIDLVLPSGFGAVGSKSTTINYSKAVICNDLTLKLNEDNYADERGWFITKSDGTVVVDCTDFSICPGGGASGSLPAASYVFDFNLPDGCYTFTITDSYGDGQFDGNTTGNYELSCSTIIHAFGEGNWGSEESTDFCVNP